jgi:hypothetical protein
MKPVSFLSTLFLILAITGCTTHASSNSSARADYGLGFSSNAPVHTKELVLSNGHGELTSSGGGFLGGGFWNPDDPNSMPEGGKFHVLIGENIVPTSARAVWFSYRNQKFYEADIKFIPNLPELFKEYKTAFGENTYRPTITFGFGQDGEIKSVLSTSCSYQYECGKSEKKTTIASGKGREIAGNTKAYLPITKQLIKQGRLKPIFGIED